MKVEAIQLILKNDISAGSPVKSNLKEKPKSNHFLQTAKDHFSVLVSLSLIGFSWLLYCFCLFPSNNRK